MTELFHPAPASGPGLTAVAAAAIVNINLAVGAAILVVIALRGLVTRLQGPALASQLWIAPLMAAIAAPVIGLLDTAPDGVAEAFGRRPALAMGAVLVWGAGVLILAVVFAVAQACFEVELKAGRAGPAAIGFFAPKVVLPTDDGAYSPAERELIRAHEREHVARKDTRALAFTAFAQCLCWFNPLVHLAAGLLRLDQELACDAAVILRRPGARGLYARTLLKSQLGARAGPLACCWRALGVHPLELRIAHLKRPMAASSGSVVHPAADAIRP